MKHDIRQPIVQSRLADYHAVMRTTIYGLVATGAAIHFGPEGYSAPLTMLVITLAAYGILAGNTSLDDLAKLSEDMEDDIGKSAYGKGVKARNIGMLKMISSALLGLTGIAELYAIFI